MGQSSRIVFMGTPRFAVPSLKALIEAGHSILAVVTQPDKPRGRGLSSLPSPVKEEALRHNIPVYEPQKLRDEEFLHALEALSPEFIVVVAYGKILPETVLKIPPKGCVNLHASLLPKYRGAAPINWAIINGETETGASTMLMDKGMDTGPVLLEERMPIGDGDTAEDLFIRLSEKGAVLLARTIDLLSEGNLSPLPQDDSEATYAPMLKKEDGKIDWTKPALAIGNLVRGVYPWPGAYTTWKGRVIKVHKGAPAEGPGDGEPGTVVKASREGIFVKCSEGVFEIKELQPENKKRMTAAEFVQGYRVEEGERFA